MASSATSSRRRRPAAASPRSAARRRAGSRARASRSSSRAWPRARGSASTSSKRAGARKRRLASPTTTSTPRSTIDVPAADRARPPQLGHRVVEVGQVVGVEDDPLRVALAVADAQLVDEVGHRPHASKVRADVGTDRDGARRGASAPVSSPPREVVQSHLERIEAVNPRVNAIVTLARARARASRSPTNAPPGPLHGLPIAVKDLEETAGMRTTYGSPLFVDHIPTADSLLASSACAGPARSSSARPIRRSSGRARRPSTRSSARRATPTT